MNIQEVVEQARIRAKVPKITDLFSDTDETALEFLGYANMMANKIYSAYGWQAVRSDYEFTTAGFKLVNLPEDFDSMITYFIYDKSRNEVIPSETDDESLGMVARNNISQSLIKFRLMGNKIQFTYNPDAGREMSFTYKKKNYVDTCDVLTTTFTENDSTFLMDDELLILGILYQRSVSLGFADLVIREAEYQAKLNELTNKDQGKMKFNILDQDDRKSNRTTNEEWQPY